MCSYYSYLFNDVRSEKTQAKNARAEMKRYIHKATLATDQAVVQNSLVLIFSLPRH